MEEVKKIVSRMQGTQRTFTSEKKQIFDRRKVCICECPDTLKPTWWPVMAVRITVWFHGHLACVNVQHRDS